MVVAAVASRPSADCGLSGEIGEGRMMLVAVTMLGERRCPMLVEGEMQMLVGMCVSVAVSVVVAAAAVAMALTRGISQQKRLISAVVAGGGVAGGEAQSEGGGMEWMSAAAASSAPWPTQIPSPPFA